MARRGAAVLGLLILLPLVAPQTVHGSPVSRVNCSYVRQLGTNLSNLSTVVKDTPRLSPAQAKQRTDAVRLRQMSLELGNTRQVVPKPLDTSIINALSAVQRAATSRARHRSPDFRRYLSQAQREMNTAWKLYGRFKAAQHCR